MQVAYTAGMKYILQAYVPTKVILKRSEDDGRSWVALPETPNNELWVATSALYHTEAECIIGNTKVLESGIKQMEYEAKQNMKRVEAAKKMLHSVSPAARIEKLESLVKALYHNLKTIQYGGKKIKDTATQVLTKESLEWIESHNIPNLDK
jgi:hypothetical protein